MKQEYVEKASRQSFYSDALEQKICGYIQLPFSLKQCKNKKLNGQYKRIDSATREPLVIGNFCKGQPCGEWLYFDDSGYDKIKITKTKQRVGAICGDGSRSYATGQGACSWHGGVSQWLYEIFQHQDKSRIMQPVEQRLQRIKAIAYDQLQLPQKKQPLETEYLFYKKVMHILHQAKSNTKNNIKVKQIVQSKQSQTVKQDQNHDQQQMRKLLIEKQSQIIRKDIIIDRLEKKQLDVERELQKVNKALNKYQTFIRQHQQSFRIQKQSMLINQESLRRLKEDPYVNIYYQKKQKMNNILNASLQISRPGKQDLSIQMCNQLSLNESFNKEAQDTKLLNSSTMESLQISNSISFS